MTEDFGADFIERDIRTIPGSQHITQAHQEMEMVLGRKLPETFPISLAMATLMSREGNREELVIPEDPHDAIYWLGFNPASSHKLKDSILVRITDRPQTLTGIIDYPQIDDILEELRAVYDSKWLRRLKRLRTSIKISRMGWGPGLYFLEPDETMIYLVYPQNGRDVAREFEEILRRHGAIEPLSRQGYEEFYERVENEKLGVRTFYC